jgi:hypothetical protein
MNVHVDSTLMPRPPSTRARQRRWRRPGQCANSNSSRFLLASVNTATDPLPARHGPRIQNLSQSDSSLPLDHISQAFLPDLFPNFRRRQFIDGTRFTSHKPFVFCKSSALFSQAPAAVGGRLSSSRPWRPDIAPASFLELSGVKPRVIMIMLMFMGRIAGAPRTREIACQAGYKTQ